MRVPTAESEYDLEEIKVAGGSLVEDEAVFSSDSRFLFVVNDGKVLSYNTATGELAGCLEAASAVVAAVPDTVNPRHLTTTDAQANLTFWDHQLGTSLKKRNLSALTSDGSTAGGLLRPEGSTDPYLLLRRAGAAEDTADLVRPPGDAPGRADLTSDPADPADLGAGSAGRGLLLVKGVRRRGGRWQAAFGNQGRMVAALVADNAIMVRNVWGRDEAKKKVFNTLRTDAARPFTCVACQRAEPVVAAGDSSGRLLLWRRLLQGQPPVRSILHWHTLPLPSVSFSPDGSYLLTGGEECVLVYWHTSDEKPSFLPRLGMPIRHVIASPDGQLVATSHSDNVIRLVSPQRQVVQLLRGLSWGAADRPATGLLLHPTAGALMLNGATGHLQLFSAHQRRDMFSLDVVQANYLTRERSGSPVTCDVTRAAVTAEWLATVEERDDGKLAPERRLKFWRWDDVQQSYTLNTCVEDPHDGAVTELLFQPGEPPAPLAVTVGTDGAIKYWSLVDDSDIYGSRCCWSCDAVGSHRHLAASCAAFSEDGARLAVGFSASLTVWEPESNRLLHTLSSVALRDPVRQVVFGRGECCHLVVTRADSGLRVWSLETQRLIVRIDARITLLVADPLTEYMAAFTASRKVIVFRPSSSRPVHQAALTRPVTAGCFVPHRGGDRAELPTWQRRSQLYFLTDQQALHTLDVADSAAACAPAPAAGEAPTSHVTPPAAGEAPASHVTPPTAFSALLAQQSRSAVTPGQQRSQAEVTPDLQRALEMVEAPSHTLPPLTRLCASFVEGVLYPRSRELPDEAMDESGPTPQTQATEETPERRPRGPSVESRLDHLLAADMTWLAV